jgi:hypothetical protein
MSDVQANDAAALDEAAVNATIVHVDANMPPADAAPADEHAADAAPAVDHATHFSYVRDELDAIAFGIVSGVNNGVERVRSLIRHVESLL